MHQKEKKQHKRKYSLQEKSLKFILFLIFAKIAYLILESDYNGQILELVTSVKATREDFNALENLGHQLTAVGITLLLLPLFFYLAKRMKSVAASIFVFTSLCTTSIVGTYQGLTYLMDYIIAKQSEKRYESYYISAFKYAMLGGHVGYETFIPQENIQRMDIDDRVMVVNLFLLTHIDPTLLNKIVSKGKNHFLDIFIEQYGMDDMKKAKKDLLDVATKINDGWVKLQEKQKILKNSFSSEVIKRNVIGDYRIFTDELNNKYKEYLKAEKEFVLELNSQLKKIDQYYSNLQRYFRYKNTARAQEQYSKDMYANFGRYIHPSTWCDGTECPSKKAIEAQIRREAKRTWDMKTGGLPMGLGQKPFFRHEVVRKQTIDGLKNKGILVDRSFNYSFEQFQKAYYKKVDKEQKANIQKLIKGFKEESGVNIRINMSYEQYVELFRAKIAERFSKKEIQEEAIRMVKSGDFSDFYNKVFRPSVQDKYFKEYLLTKEDFQKSKNQEKGDLSLIHI